MEASRSIASLPLAPSVAETLVRAGFRFVDDLRGLRVAELSQESGLSHADALKAIDALSEASSAPAGPGKATALQAYERLRTSTSRPIITFCRGLDVVLGGGVPLGQLTEICGPPGVGKTQLAIQLVLDVQIPQAYGGVGGRAVYVDTEGSFMPERAAELAASLSQHVGKIAANRRAAGASAAEAPQAPARDELLEGVAVYRAKDQAEQLAVVRALKAHLARDPAVRLVVLDSVAFHFRADLADTTTRARVLAAMAQTLTALAHEHGVAVVTINQVTTKMDRGESCMVPALGDGWSHGVASRVLLYWEGNTRCARLVKSATRPLEVARFRVCGEGIRDDAMGSGMKRSRPDGSPEGPPGRQR